MAPGKRVAPARAQQRATLLIGGDEQRGQARGGGGGLQRGAEGAHLRGALDIEAAEESTPASGWRAKSARIRAPA